MSTEMVSALAKLGINPTIPKRIINANKKIDPFLIVHPPFKFIRSWFSLLKFFRYSQILF